MIKQTLAALGFVLVAASANAQTPPLPPCIAFVPEGANGSVTLCFPENMSADMRGVFDELLARDNVQAERHLRVHEKCGDAGQFGMADTPIARTCRARIAQEMPFPTPSDAVVSVLHRYHLEWE